MFSCFVHDSHLLAITCACSCMYGHQYPCDKAFILQSKKALLCKVVPKSTTVYLLKDGDSFGLGATSDKRAKLLNFLVQLLCSIRALY